MLIVHTYRKYLILYIYCLIYIYINNNTFITTLSQALKKCSLNRLTGCLITGEIYNRVCVTRALYDDDSFKKKSTKTNALSRKIYITSASASDGPGPPVNYAVLFTRNNVLNQSDVVPIYR